MKLTHRSPITLAASLGVAAALAAGSAIAQDEPPSGAPAGPPPSAPPGPPPGAPPVGGPPTGVPAEPYPDEFDTQPKRLSYTIGTNIFRGMLDDELPLDREMLILALDDAIAGNEPKLTRGQMDATMMAIQQEMMEKQRAQMEAQQAEAAAAGETAKAEGEAYLAENGQRDGVTTTESGLQYEVIEAAPEGAAKASGKSITSVHYTGTLIDGTKFDSSVDRGEPITVNVQGGVIPGWLEALRIMEVGSKYRFHIPSDLAYGANPRPGGPIAPNSVLIFDMELLSSDDSVEATAAWVKNMVPPNAPPQMLETQIKPMLQEAGWSDEEQAEIISGVLGQ